MAVQGTIVKVSGPLIVASGMADVQMYDVVRVSETVSYTHLTLPTIRLV